MSTIRNKGTYRLIMNIIDGGDEIVIDKYNNNILREYNNYLSLIGNKDITRRLKLTSAYLFCYFFKDNDKIISNFSREDVSSYIEECDKIDWSYYMKDNNKYYIRAFLNWTFENDISKISGDMCLPKIIGHTRNKVRTYYSKEELISLINSIDRTTKYGKECYLIISIICYLGLRISDVVNLKISDIDFNNNTISIIQYKTQRHLILPLIEQIKYPLIDYLKNVRPKADLDYLFITNEKPYRQKTELLDHSYIVRKNLKKANININGRKSGYHSLRHSFATMLLSEDVDLYSISTILGHEILDTTMLYLDIDISKLKELSLEVPYVK